MSEVMARRGEGGLLGAAGWIKRQVYDEGVGFAVVQQPDGGRLGSAGRAANLDLISRRAKTEDEGKARPIGGDGGGDGEAVAAETESEHFLDPDAVHPGGRSGVPGPAGAAGLIGRGIAIGGGDVGFGGVVGGGFRIAAVLARVHQLEQADGAAAVAEADE